MAVATILFRTSLIASSVDSRVDKAARGKARAAMMTIKAQAHSQAPAADASALWVQE